MINKYNLLRSSLSLGKIYNINLKIHWSFFLLITLFFTNSLLTNNDIIQSIYKISFLCSIFFCIILHELGHCLVAQKFNYQTKQITIYPIGGVAQMEGIPKKPSQEILISIAGPLVNIIIAGLIYIYLGSQQALKLSYEMLYLEDFNKASFLFSLFVSNIILAVFNLIPAFPMDGGRVLRAFLAIKLSRKKATQIAVRIGQSIAVIFIIAGLSYSALLIFIGVFIFIAAQKELTKEMVNSPESKIL